jgi:hypothetical protein
MPLIVEKPPECIIISKKMKTQGKKVKRINNWAVNKNFGKK